MPDDSNTLTISRIINAPVAAVWKLWTEPEAVTKWWGPAEYTSPLARIDLTAGGTYLFSMRAPQYQGGEESFTTGKYKEIIPLKKLVFTQSLADSQGNPLPKSQLPADFPEEILMTVIFNEVNGMTELTITEQGWTPSRMSVFAYAGMHQSLDKMAAALK